MGIRVERGGVMPLSQRKRKEFWESKCQRLERYLDEINDIMWHSHCVQNGPPIPGDKIMEILERYAGEPGHWRDEFSTVED